MEVISPCQGNIFRISMRRIHLNAFIEADEKQGKERVTLEYSNFMATKWN